MQLLLIFCRHGEKQLAKKLTFLLCSPPPQAGVKGKLGRLLGVFEVSSRASQRSLGTNINGTDED